MPVHVDGRNHRPVGRPYELFHDLRVTCRVYTVDNEESRDTTRSFAYSVSVSVVLDCNLTVVAINQAILEVVVIDGAERTRDRVSVIVVNVCVYAVVQVKDVCCGVDLRKK